MVGLGSSNSKFERSWQKWAAVLLAMPAALVVANIIQTTEAVGTNRASAETDQRECATSTLDVEYASADWYAITPDARREYTATCVEQKKAVSSPSELFLACIETRVGVQYNSEDWKAIAPGGRINLERVCLGSPPIRWRG